MIHQKYQAEFHKLSRHPLYWLVTGVRCLGSLILLVNPALGWIVYAVLDIADGQLLPNIAGMNSVAYHIWDKYIDTVAFIAMLAVAIPYGALLPLVPLFLYRLIGQILFWRTLNERILIYFPNLFEAVWLWLVVGRQLGWWSTNSSNAWIGLGFMIALKEFQEIYCHFLAPKYLIPRWRRFIDRHVPGYYRRNPWVT